MQQLLKEYLELHGYWVLFVGTFLEGETILVLAGFLAFRGYLTLPGVVAVASCGSFLGDQFFYYFGRWKGPFLLKLSGRFVRKFRKALRLIEKYGTPVAFFSRFTYGMRLILPVCLGMTSFPPRRYLWLNLASALVWSAIFATGGYLFGKSASLFIEDLHRYEPWLIVLLLAFMVCMWTIHFLHANWRRRHARRRLLRMQLHRLTHRKEQ